ncbi:hypothetical protein BS78_02G164400 [Paspalum vaginatum]|nr:hypothetical protein BS78_02G164400 [Paspalum vaginatum]
MRGGVMDLAPLLVGLQDGAPSFPLWFFGDGAEASFPWGAAPADVRSVMALSRLQWWVSTAAFVAMFGEFMLLQFVMQFFELLFSFSEWSRGKVGVFSLFRFNEDGVQDPVVLHFISFVVFCAFYRSLYS